MKKMVVMLVGFILLFPAAAMVRAQDPFPPPAPIGQALDPSQVDQLVGPIALYPDPLIAEILPASTFPSEIVMASRYVSENGDPNQIAAQGWDPSVQALCHYANILKWMDDNLSWTTQLGQVFQNQQADVMSSVQRLRGQAQSLGNLPSTPQESVMDDGGAIEIEPTDPDQMYVPSYSPDTIYEEPGVYCTFPYALPLGIWLGYDWDWHDRGLVRWGPGHARPDNWWHESPVERHSYFAGHPAPGWHGGEPAGGERGGWARGYEAPRQSAPRIVTVRPAPIDRRSAPTQPREVATPRAERQPVRSQPPVRGQAEVRSQPPVHSQPEVRTQPPARSQPSSGFFVGGQTGREAVQSSSRGQASRASMGGGGSPPASAPRGGGGGGGGGGGHGGGVVHH